MKQFFFILFISFLSLSSLAQNKIDSNQDAEYYVKNVLLGAGIQVGNVTHVGMVGSLGQFRCDSTIIGVSKGIVLSTGSVNIIFQPNQNVGLTSENYVPDSIRSNKLFSKGDKDLNKLSKGRSKDVTIIEFDFVPIKNSIEFSYVFGSEEYNEYVGTRFNDVFGFFLSGPGIKGFDNLAIVPGSTTPISVNTINLGKNKQYYRDNSYEFTKTKLFDGKRKRDWIRLRQNIEYDGLTTVFNVKHDVEPYQLYHLKIAIGDVSDAELDSGVFLEAGSFTSTVDTTGKYYAKLEEVALNPPNIDSVLYNNENAATTVIETPEEIAETEANVFRITDIYFDFNSTELDETSVNSLIDLADYLRKNKSKKCSLVGYTDNVGSKDYNQKLSEDRAKKIIEFLTSQGIDVSRLKYSGRNFENARSDNATDTGRAQNRRVEITLE